jgi:hypothetical protein
LQLPCCNPEKLSKSNYAQWKAQVRAAMRGARLQGFLSGDNKPPATELVIKGVDGKEEKKLNPTLEDWEAMDQQVLSYLLSSLGKEILNQVSTFPMAAHAWAAIEKLFGTQTRARAVNLRIALATSQKGNMTVAEYVGKMKTLGDEMTATGRKLDDEELVEYILTGLGEDFNHVISAVCARVEPISVGEVYSQLLHFESHQELLYGSQHHASMNTVNRRGSWRGRGGPTRGRGGSRGGSSAHRGGVPGRGTRGNHHGGMRGAAGYNNYNHISHSDVPCQVCFKKNHSAAECWHRFDENYVPDQRLAATATTSYGVDTN